MDSVGLSYKVKKRRLTDVYLTADNGNRTRLSSLGSWHSTNELYPHVFSITANRKKEKQKNKKI